MPPPAQRITSISINSLKGLSNLDMDFTPHPITAIMGVNGSGKSTILHALACCYKPYNAQSHNYVFSEFFLPNTDSRWAGSKFTLHYEHDLAPPVHLNQREYRKIADRWSPRYATRLQRWVAFIGIKGAVPAIEELTTKSFVTLQKSNRVDANANNILQSASYILNRNYTILTSNVRQAKVYVGVQYKGTAYSAISMGSGEQRVFKILESLYSAPDYGLLLIDELELLMHTDALIRMIKELDRVARIKHLQIIFTTHAESVLNLKDKINVRHLYIAENGDALCFKNANPKLLYALTGVQTKTLKVFVEDELAREIVAKVAKELGIKKDVAIDIYGPAINCFTTASGAVLSGIDISDCLFVLDGDLYTTREEKKTRINAVLTGTDYQSKRKKVTVLSQIAQLNLPPNQQPERYLHSIIAQHGVFANAEFEEIRQAALQIQGVANNHHFIDDIVSRLGYAKDDYKDIVNLLSQQPFWAQYTNALRMWLTKKQAQHNL